MTLPGAYTLADVSKAITLARLKARPVLIACARDGRCEILWDVDAPVGHRLRGAGEGLVVHVRVEAGKMPASRV
jgi:hypothetical protein